MKLLPVAILLTILSSTYGLSCLITDDGEPMELLLSGDDSDEIIEMIEGLSSDDYDDDEVCRIELYIDYKKQHLSIDFTEHLTDSGLVVDDVQIDIYVTGDEIDEINTRYYLEYACSDDGCELEFVTKYINWFIDVDKSEVIDQLAPYILGNVTDENGHCLNQYEMVEECSTAHCVATVYKEDDGKLISNPKCDNDNDRKVVGLWFTMEFNNELGSDDWWYEFRCDYDHCNDQSTLNNVISTFHKEYDIHSILKEFGYEDRGQEETTTFSAKSSTSQQQTNPPRSSASINSVTSTLTTSFFKPSSISSPVQSTPSASPIPSSTVTSSIKSTTVTSPASNSPSDTAVTTIDGTTPKSNHALRRQSSNTVIYIALIIILSHLLFLL